MARCTRPSARGRTGRSRLRWPRRTCPEPGSLCAMGLLDEAIREHLELKRRRGADPTEVERLEREALGPVRRIHQEPAATDVPGAEQGHVAYPAGPAVPLSTAPADEAAFEGDAGFQD